MSSTKNFYESGNRIDRAVLFVLAVFISVSIGQGLGQEPSSAPSVRMVVPQLSPSNNEYQQYTQPGGTRNLSPMVPTTFSASALQPAQQTAVMPGTNPTPNATNPFHQTSMAMAWQGQPMSGAGSDGKTLFGMHCTTCHEADRSLKARKTQAEWNATITRMAELAKTRKKPDIPAEAFMPISTYLANVAGKDAKSGAGETEDKDKPKKEKSAEEKSKITAGQSAFQSKCTTCHDADRSLQTNKSLAEWRSTVQRMAGKPGASIGSDDVESISMYLADRGEAGGEGAGKGKGGGSSISTFATISPLWRSGSSQIQNNGFFPEAFFGAAWQGKNGLSARVTACTSCHGNGEPGFLNRVELLEAVARLDIMEFLGKEKCTNFRAAVEAGRFVVPFGAFSAQVNPGVYRTVSKPLMFNMGQRVRDGDIGDVVLPLPYSDEGVLLSLAATPFELGEDKVTTTLDLYAVNGLIGGTDGIDFDRSRELLDNNSRVAWGSRATIGTPAFRVGGSVTGGQFNDKPYGDPFYSPMRYFIYGFDVSYRHKDLFRLQAEYARRSNDRYNSDTNGLVQEHVEGVYVESECRLQSGSPVSFLCRYDWLGRGSPLPIPDSAMDKGTFNLTRLTFGVNYAVSSQSLLMLNYERWLMPKVLGDFDVWGVRFALTF